MTTMKDIAIRYYRLGLAAAKRRDLSCALYNAELACLFSSFYRASGQNDARFQDFEQASHLVRICRYELGAEAGLERITSLAGQKKWYAAIAAAKAVPHQSVRLLNIQGCLWFLAKRYAQAAACFAQALSKDRGNRLAADALVEISRRRTYFWRFL
jgi:tetratricopeptide (TPR) repeat protein